METKSEKIVVPTAKSAVNLDTPKDALAAYINALKSKDEDAIKKTIMAKGKEKIETHRKEMKMTFYEYVKPSDEGMKTPIIGEVKIDGNKATLFVKSSEKKPKWLPLLFVKEADGWNLRCLMKWLGKTGIAFEKGTRRI